MLGTIKKAGDMPEPLEDIELEALDIETIELETKGSISVLIAYHDHCIDGFTSAWVAARKLKELGTSYAMLPMSYHEDSYSLLLSTLHRNKFTTLYVLDFSLPVSTLAEINNTATRGGVVILDHHKTAFERYCPQMEVKSDSTLRIRIEEADIRLDNLYSGAGLAWRFFYPEVHMPKLVGFVQDHDLWTFHKGEDTKAINKFLCTIPKTLDKWEEVYSDLEGQVGLRNLLAAGHKMLAEFNLDIAIVADKASLVNLAGITMPCVQCEYKYMSSVGHILAEQAESGMALMFATDVAAGIIKWSIRSKEGVDCSAIAKKFGGGGHMCASGFTTPLIQRHTL